MKRQFTAAAMAAAALLAASSGALAADAVGITTLTTTPGLSAGQSVSAAASLVKSGYSSNSALAFSAWAHAGSWYTFQLATDANVSIDLQTTNGVNFAPGLTLWASGSNAFDGGVEGTQTSDVSGWGDPHSFNATGQVANGDFGTNWMSTAAGSNMLQTLAYAVSGPSFTADQTGWGETITNGAHDVSINNTFESGITGSVTATGLHLDVNALKTGWYTVYIGGTNHAGVGGNVSLAISALAPVPEPGTWALMLGGVAALSLRRRQKA